MNRPTLIAYALSVCLVGSLSAQQPDYKNPELPPARRVRDLLSRMTVEEKVAQLRSMIASKPRLTDSVVNNAAKMDSLFKHGIGMMNPDFDATLEQAVTRRNALQQYLRTKTRLGIPVIFLDEAHHGLLATESDVFPHSIGFATSWDPALIEKVYRHVAGQANSRGTSLILSPVVDVTRDPRWGRTGESFGEDPYISGTLGAAVVRGFQGSNDGAIAPGHVGSTLKVLAGHGQTEGGLNQGPTDVSLRVLRENHLEPFRLSILNSKPTAIMASYDDIDGVPSHANRWLLKDVLRNEWRFDGVVVSDWYGIDMLWNKHRVATDQKDAALQAFNAGVTIDLPLGVNYARLVELAKEKKINMAALDTAVGQVLALKFKLGLFEAPLADLQRAKSRVGTPEGRALALEAASASMVLLKNSGNLLPIRPGQYKKIAVIGPNAAVNYLGDYSGIPVRNVSLLDGVKAKVGDRGEVLYAKGVMLTKNADTTSYVNFQLTNRPVFPTHEENRALIAEAVAVAEQADFVIVAVGENEQLGREAWLPDHFGDMNTLDLQSDQDELVQAIMATKKPVMVYLAHGRPLSINWIAEHVPAIVDGWYAGEEAGTAFANILFGETNPSGKLTITYPRSVGQLPMYYNYKPSARGFEYVTGPSTPLFPFGYGLSYTTFSYSAPRLSQSTMKKNGAVTAEVDVTNTGQMQGDEIVQLYIHQKVSSVTRPVKALKGFTKIRLTPGEKKTVRFTIDASTLAFWTASMQRAVEQGTIEIMIGPSSADLQTVELRVTES